MARRGGPRVGGGLAARPAPSIPEEGRRPQPAARTACAAMAVIVREAGKTLATCWETCARPSTSCATTRGEARRLSACPVSLRGPTGETNTMELRGRGPFACISRRNFPVVIFTGQVAAARRPDPGAGRAGRADAHRRVPGAAEPLNAAGLPPGVLQPWAGRRRGGGDAGEGSERGGRRLHRLQRHRLGDPERAAERRGAKCR